MNDLQRLCMLLLIVSLSAVGCATVTVPPSGFIKDEIPFETDPTDTSRLIYEKPGVDWQRYTRLMIDPVVVYFHPQAENRGIRVDELKKLTDALRNTVIETVRHAFPVVDQPGPNVLRIRAAITDLKPADPAMNMVSTAVLMVPVDMGSASIEAEFLDSTTGQRLGAIIDKKIASPADLKFYKGFTRWGHAEEAFRAWARELLQELETTGKP